MNNTKSFERYKMFSDCTIKQNVILMMLKVYKYYGEGVVMEWGSQKTLQRVAVSLWWTYKKQKSKENFAWVV